MKKIRSLYKHPLFVGGTLVVGGNMIANIINYVYHLVMGRILGPVDYGILASLYSLLYLISIVPSSASIAIVKFISSAKSDAEVYSIYKTLKKFVLRLSIGLSFLILILSPLIGNFLNIKNVVLILPVSIILFFSLFTLVNQATAQGLLKFLGLIGPTLIGSFLKLIVGVGLVFIGWSVFGAISGVVVGAIVAYLYSVLFINKVLKKSSSKDFNIWPFLKYSLPVLVQAFAFTSLFTADVILVKHFFSGHDAGIYAALSTLGKIIFFASAPIAAAMFPTVSRRKSHGERYANIFLISLGITLAISSVIVIFYWLFPGFAITLLYGDAYLSAKPELVWMGIFILFYSISSLLVNFSLSTGKTKIVVFPFAAAILQIICLWIRHISLMQVIQTSLSIVVLNFFVMLVYLIYNRQKEAYVKE